MISHSYEPRIAYLNGKEPAVELDECGFVTYYDHNAGAVDGTNHCGRKRHEHPELPSEAPSLRVPEAKTMRADIQWLFEDPRFLFGVIAGLSLTLLLIVGHAIARWCAR